MSEPRRVIAAIAGALVVIVLVWFVVLYRPKAAEISELREQADAAAAEEQTLRATLEQLQSVDEDRPDEEAEVRRLTAAIPPDPELANFILAIHDIAARSDVSFASIAPGLPSQVAGQSVSTIATTLTVAGGFPNVVDFLDRLEEMERVLVVDSLAINASDESATTGESDASATASAPASPTSPTVGGAGSTPLEFSLGDGATGISVRTDAASAGQVAPTTTTTLDPRASALLVPRESATRILDRTLSVSITARIFTTAAPTTGEGAGTTTTTVAGTGTTTTTASGG